MSSSNGSKRFDWARPPGQPKRLARSLASVTVASFLIAICVVLYPSATDLWAAHAQARMRHEHLASIGEAADGDPVLRLDVPAIGLHATVVEGVGEDSLRVGVGHYPSTGAPGIAGNIALAGHRTTYGKPFNRLDELDLGDEIRVRSDQGTFVYQVEREPWVVSPTDWSPIRDFPSSGSFITLTSCHPEGSAATRIVARARLVSVSMSRPRPKEVSDRIHSSSTPRP
jgi:sortase A